MNNEGKQCQMYQGYRDRRGLVMMSSWSQQLPADGKIAPQNSNTLTFPDVPI